MIQSLTVLQAYYAFYWNYKVFVDCEFWSRMLAAIIDINMFVIGILITYYMYIAVDMIYKFSMKGRLPRESRRKRLQCVMITMICVGVVGLATYITTLFILYDREKYYLLGKLDIVFGVCRSSGMAASAGILGFTIYKLERAKVKRTDSGHLKIVDIAVLLSLQIVMVVLGFVSIFYTNDHHTVFQIYIGTSRDVIDFLLGVMYFKMMIHFITKFKL